MSNETNVTTGPNDTTPEIGEGFAMIRKVRGPQGIHPLIGLVVPGGIYTVEIPVAVQVTAGAAAEFEPLGAADQAKIGRARAESAAAANN